VSQRVSELVGVFVYFRSFPSPNQNTRYKFKSLSCFSTLAVIGLW